MPYREESGWSDKTELECYLIFRKCEAARFPYGMITELCSALALRYEKPPFLSLRAKVGLYKSLAGINNPSHPPQGSKKTYGKYKKSSIEDIQATLDRMP